MESLAEFIQARREKAGLSITGLANKTNIKLEILEDGESIGICFILTMWYVNNIFIALIKNYLLSWLIVDSKKNISSTRILLPISEIHFTLRSIVKYLFNL